MAYYRYSEFLNKDLALRHNKKQNKGMCLEAVKQDINLIVYVDIKYTKCVYNYLKSINFIKLDKNYNFLINRNKIRLRKLLNSQNYVNYLWGIKYIKQDLFMCKLVMKKVKKIAGTIYHSTFFSYTYRVEIFSYDIIYSYFNYKKQKLCLQLVKTFNNGYKYINKQNIIMLL